MPSTDDASSGAPVSEPHRAATGDDLNCVESCLVQCPYCGETQTLLVDTTLPAGSLVEDCQVCCQPMVLEIRLDGDQPSVRARQENN